ncbi:MAG: biopolymer transporter ExbD [Phototrophicales bacterium]|nr:MAG: biopolymer transporter ExbD [Phototrophicales bacterium]
MRRRKRRSTSEAELDITAFMNLMIVLVPILLINMIFAHTSVLELNFPKGSGGESDNTWQLQVVIQPESILVSSSAGHVIKQIHKVPELASAQTSTKRHHDFDSLTKVMQSIKQRYPDKKDVTIMAQKSTPYQILVSVMDRVRAYRTVVAGSVVQAELFPEISIADAPVIDRQAMPVVADGVASQGAQIGEPEGDRS